MTRTLRQRHRRMWLALAVVLPTLYLAGWLARRPVPVHPGPLGFSAASFPPTATPASTSPSP